ncbi:hypothetical protein GUJ93_ZPchr0005g15978 [Zizania palustris]|nr:hypothetical protein GUJ93_ZPchr0005g15978 [Zizania palustris]KAG8067258.1 hypothetical protein GUJ93_ZPchr0005g15978 [Zizania palustris]KAG8067259.1 hypothetical protein GUJ93_ZPchr0005g15978 [Zizania palustris]
MDLLTDPELIFGDEFCFPPIITYYPTAYAPTGASLPPELYEHQTILGWDDQGPHYSGQQAEGTSCMYYVVPDYGVEYGTAHSPHGPYLSDSGAIADGTFVGNQEYLANTAESTNYQPVPTSPFAFLPSVVDAAPASTSQTPASTSQTLANSVVESSVSGNPYIQSTSFSSEKFEDHMMLPNEQMHSSVSWQQQLAGRPNVPAELRHAQQASQHHLHGEVPPVKPPPQTNPSHNYHVPYIGADLCKMASSEKFQPRPKPRSYADGSSRSLSLLSRKNLCKTTKPVNPMPSEIVVTSYSSRLHIGDSQGKIIIRTDQYNRYDFQVVYPHAKFFVIKSYSEADVHKSIKYGVWSCSFSGNHKLDKAFRDAQEIAASRCMLCPVFLFFSVNASFHFCGVAEMVGPVDFQKHMDFWRNHKWVGSFPVRWHIIKNVPNHILRYILLRNNEDKPVTSSRNTQEIHYIPGTSMLKVFKDYRTRDCLLNQFMLYEEAEARGTQHMRSKLRCDAPHFIPASTYDHRACASQKPKAASVPMNRIAREAHHLTDKLHNVSLYSKQGSWEESRSPIGSNPKANAGKFTIHSGNQARESFVKAVTYQPQARQSALNREEQPFWKVEVVATEKKHLQTAANVSPEPPEGHPNEIKNEVLAQSSPGTPENAYEEQKVIRKHCSLAATSQIGEASSSCLGDVMTIGSVLVPIKMFN